MLGVAAVLIKELAQLPGKLNPTLPPRPPVAVMKELNDELPPDAPVVPPTPPAPTVIV
jgi:hypothetical protein